MDPIILTGMHRSGTSAIARLIQSLGIDLGSNLLPATVNNLHGHFEEMAFIHFHDELIKQTFPALVPFCEWLPLIDVDTACSEADYEKARTIWKAHQAAGGIAWKDPRTSLFLDLWAKVLPQARIVICLRHPYQVHLSLLRRGEPFLHVDYSAGIRGWAIYNRRILRSIANLPRDRFVIVDVEKAFREPKQLVEQLAGFLGTGLPDSSFSMITPGDFNFEESLHEPLEHFGDFFPEITEIYQALQVDLSSSALPKVPASATKSAEIRLLEFEERSNLREKAKEMLVRSIGADRDRYLDFNRLNAAVDMERDRLIEDLARFNEQLKNQVLYLMEKTKSA